MLRTGKRIGSASGASIGRAMSALMRARMALAFALEPRDLDLRRRLFAERLNDVGLAATALSVAGTRPRRSCGAPRRRCCRLTAIWRLTA